MANFTTPSAKIDAAICNLLARIYNFSDLDFETEAVGLREEEIELIVVRLIEEIRDNLTGRILSLHLQEIRPMERNDGFLFGSLEDV